MTLLFCPSHSDFRQINGITSFMLRNMEAIKGRGDLATTQNYPYVTNVGGIKKDMHVYKVDSLLTTIAFSSHKNGFI